MVANYHVTKLKYVLEIIIVFDYIIVIIIKKEA